MTFLATISVTSPGSLSSTIIAAEKKDSRAMKAITTTIITAALAPSHATAALQARQTPGTPSPSPTSFVIPTHTSQCSSAYAALDSPVPKPIPELASHIITYIPPNPAPWCTVADDRVFTPPPHLSSAYASWGSELDKWMEVSGVEFRSNLQEWMALCASLNTLPETGYDECVTTTATTKSDGTKIRSGEVAATQTGAGETGAAIQTPGNSGAAASWNVGWNFGWAVAGVGMVAILQF